MQLSRSKSRLATTAPVATSTTRSASAVCAHGASVHGTCRGMKSFVSSADQAAKYGALTGLLRSLIGVGSNVWLATSKRRTSFEAVLLTASFLPVGERTAE
jgi:hypothetical protein